MFAGVVHRNGNERDQKIAQYIVDKGWNTTMVLTEPDAGSDVGAGRAKATANDDGTWNITGVKRFITSGESDLYDNIVHLVLARPVGVEGAGGPGTKGLSMFIVPSTTSTHETGGGRRAQRRVRHRRRAQDGHQGVQHLRAHLRRPGRRWRRAARGWLLGEVHNGIAQMFQVIENARMMVGTKAITTLSSGYLQLDFAKRRVQGADLTQAADKTAPRRSPTTPTSDVR